MMVRHFCLRGICRSYYCNGRAVEPDTIRNTLRLKFFRCSVRYPSLSFPGIIYRLSRYCFVMTKNIQANRSWLFVILVALILFSYSLEGVPMSLFKGKEVCIFSSMEGIITYQGKPASGAKIVRKVKWKDQKGESDFTIAGENGEFKFVSMNRILRRIFPVQFVASQEIYVYYKGQEFHIWTMGKLESQEYGELGGVPKNFRCELTGELLAVEVERGLLGTSCTWDSIK